MSGDPGASYMGRFEESVAALRDAVQIEPNYGWARFNLAYVKLGRERESDGAGEAGRSSARMKG